MVKKSKKQSYCEIWIHLVWATQYREPMIQKSWKKAFYDQFRQISDQNDYGLDFINGMEDHVHLLINHRPKRAISDIVKDLKGNTWRWARDYLSDKETYLTWQDGYSAFFVSPERVEQVRNYIRNQEKHHAFQNYDEEIQKLKQASS